MVGLGGQRLGTRAGLWIRAPLREIDMMEPARSQRGPVAPGPCLSDADSLRAMGLQNVAFMEVSKALENKAAFVARGDLPNIVLEVL